MTIPIVAFVHLIALIVLLPGRSDSFISIGPKQENQKLYGISSSAFFS